MTEPTKIPSDIHTRRTLIQIDEDGELHGIEIGTTAQPMTLVIHERGGLATIPGSIEQLLRARTGEPGAERLASVHRLLSGFPIAGVNPDTALPIDRLEGAIAEYLEQRNTIAGHVDDLREIGTIALDVLSSGNIDGLQVSAEKAFSQVAELARMASDWREGAARLAREGIVEVGAADGPEAFYQGLRVALKHKDEVPTASYIDSGPEPADGVRIMVRLGWQQKPAEDFEALHSIAAAAALQAANLRLHGAGDATVHMVLPAEVYDLGAQQTSQATGDGRVIPLFDALKSAFPMVEIRREGDTETEAEYRRRASRVVMERRGTEQEIIGAVKQVLGDVKVRLHKPGAGILRIILPATVAPADADAALELLRGVVPVTVAARVELEPGKPPEGWYVTPTDSAEGSEESAWIFGCTDGEPQGGSDTEAAAVDLAWEGEILANEADAEGLAGESPFTDDGQTHGIGEKPDL